MCVCVLCAFKFLKIFTSLDLNFGGKIFEATRDFSSFMRVVVVVVTRYDRARAQKWFEFLHETNTRQSSGARYSWRVLWLRFRRLNRRRRLNTGAKN